MYSITKELKEQLELISSETSETGVYMEVGYTLELINVARNTNMLTNESCNAWLERTLEAKKERLHEIFN